jgi:Domain of unknown function (DUF3425)/Fungal Zn(2)-Cys(6) binuclear cluster domain
MCREEAFARVVRITLRNVFWATLEVACRQNILPVIEQYDNKAMGSSRSPKMSVATSINSDTSTSTNSKSYIAVKSKTLDIENSFQMSNHPHSINSEEVAEVSDSTVESPIDVISQPQHSKQTRARSCKTRIGFACLQCKKRRRKCTGEKPCQTCTDFHRDCVYDPTQDRRSKAYFQKRLADGVLEALQSDQNEKLMDLLRQNRNIDNGITTDIQRALKLVETLNASPTSFSPSSIPSQSVLDSPSADQKNYPVCSSFCALCLHSSSRAPWYLAELQNRQLNLFKGPEHLILPHVITDSSPLSKMFMGFRMGVNKLLQQGTPLDEALGDLDPKVDLLFRQRNSSDPFSACTWACELSRLNVQWDIYTQLANTFLLARFMRWTLAPTLENYMLLPEIMRLTVAQRTIPHYPSADMYSIPWVRDSLISGEEQLSQPINNPLGAGIFFNWPFDLDKAVDRDPITGTTTISRLLGACAGMPGNWSCSTDFLANTPMNQGVFGSY